MKVTIAFENKTDFDPKAIQAAIDYRFTDAEVTCVFLDNKPILDACGADAYFLVASIECIKQQTMYFIALQVKEKTLVPVITLAESMNTEVGGIAAAIHKYTKCQIIDYACSETTRSCQDLIFEIYASAYAKEKFIFNFIPTGQHPGAFGVKRRHHYHTGVDLYVHRTNAVVKAFEDGEIMSYGHFTGTKCNSPWWNDTHYIALKHGKHVIVYGEIALARMFIDEEGNVDKQFVGGFLKKGIDLGIIMPVTKKRHPEYEYHNTKMLHFELYNADTFVDAAVDEWELDDKQPGSLLDPTNYIVKLQKKSNGEI